MKNFMKKLTVMQEVTIFVIVPTILLFSLYFFVIRELSLRGAQAHSREDMLLFADDSEQTILEAFGACTVPLNITKQTLEKIDPKHAEAVKQANAVLLSALEVSNDVYCAWFAFEPGSYYEDRRYIKEYLFKDGKITETFDINDELLDSRTQAYWYVNPLESGKPYFMTANYYDYGDGAMYIASISYPVMLDGKVIGVVGMDFLYENMFGFIENWQIENGRNVMLTTQDGFVIYSPTALMHETSLFSKKFEDQRGLRMSMYNGETYLNETYSPFFNAQSLVCIEPVNFTEGGSLYLYVERPLSAIYKQSYQVINFSLLAVIILIVIGFFSSFMQSKRIVARIVLLKDKAEEVAAGNFDVNFDEIVDPKNELSLLQNSLRKMLWHIRSYFNEITDFSQTLECRIIERTNELQLMTESAEKAKEEALRSSEIKTQFLANMSHEIRTPMNAIIGMSELLSHEPLTITQANYVEDISVSANGLLNIINDILDFSKFDSGVVELQPVSYDLHLMLDNVRSMFQFLVSKKAIQLRYEEVGDIPRCLFGDDVRLRQVLINLLNNALKFTHDGYIMLKVTAEDYYLTFDVIDTGEGIKEDGLAHLFEPFTQLDTYKNRNIKGTGLGLSICKRFVEQMHGDITVTSVYGTGSTFRVKVPKIYGDESQLNIQTNDGLKFTAKEAKVLVVDDNRINLNVANGLLRLYGITPTLAESGYAAIDFVKENTYDIVFMDHMMPELDGLETTAIIRGLGGEHATQTIIALSANAVAGAKEMFMASKMNDFISKPIEKNKLVDILIKWIPKEKIVYAVDPNAPAEHADNGFIEKAAAIEDLEVETALARFGGVTSILEKTLKILHDGMTENIAKTDGFVENGDIKSFAIEVHGMKGALNSVGAIRLASVAYDLESAAKSKNDEAISLIYPQFKANLKKFDEKLGVLFESNSDNAQKPQGDAVLAAQKLSEIASLLEDFDANTASEIIEQLKTNSYGAEIDEKLDKISHFIDVFDYDSAVALINN